VRKLLILILLFLGITAALGGIELIRTNGMGMPQEWLATTPFSSFLIPGLVLSLIVGGASLVSSLLLIRRHNYALESSAIAGFGVQIWIFTQIYMLQHASFLQIFYFGTGILILILTIFLLRKKSS